MFPDILSLSCVFASLFAPRLGGTSQDSQIEQPADARSGDHTAPAYAHAFVHQRPVVLLASLLLFKNAVSKLIL